MRRDVGPDWRSAVQRPVSRASAVVLVVAAVTAGLVRIVPFFLPDEITAVREYDDGVMLGAAIAMLAGRAPYADFYYLHPPGSVLTLLPVAGAAWVWGEPAAMALARVALIVVAVANTALIGYLLRHYGWFAVAVGAGAYAVWPVGVATERTVLLEPILNLGLLVALALLQTWRRHAVIAVGVCLGVATTVKVWAIIDVAIVALVVAAAFGVRKLATFLIAVAATIAAICLPFFLSAPANMWEQVVVAQLVRVGTDATLVQRADQFSLATGIHAIDLRIPPEAWLVVLIALIAIGSLPLVEDIRRRVSPGAWTEASWWALILLAHVLVLVISRGFFYHYASWVLAPLCLSVGYVASLLPRRARLWVRPVVIATLCAVLIADVIGSVRHPSAHVGGTEQLAEWSHGRTCVAGGASQLIAADAFRRNLANDCSFDVDGLGAYLAGDLATSGWTDDPSRSTWWRERQFEMLAESDGALTPAPGGPPWWMSDDEVRRFEAEFEQVGVFGGIGAWVRADE